MKKLMTTGHPRWKEFILKLMCEDGIRLRREDKDWSWECPGDFNKPIARRILKDMEVDIDIELTMRYFEEHGGNCDCEILWNVHKGEDK